MTSSNIETVAPKALSQRLANEFLNTQSHFAIPGDIKDQTTGTPLNPGLADIQLAKIEQIGHRDKFPRPYDWENLVPLLLPGEELLWIIEKRGQDFSIYLGLKKNERQIDGVHVVRERRKHFEVLCNHFARRSFPESHIILLEPEHVLFFLKKTYTDYNDGVTCVTGIPSPKAINEETIYEERDEQTRPFASLNDVLEPLIEEDQFTIVFCVGRANGLQVLEKLQAKAELRNDIAPLIKQEVNISKTDTNEHHEEQTGGIVDGTSSQDSPNIVKKLLQFLTGADERGWGRRPALGKQHSTNTGWSKGESHSTTVDTGMGFTAFNATLDFIDKALELSMRHLQQAMGAGGFFGSSMIYAAEEQSRNRIARSMCATLAGSHSYLRPMQGLPFNGPNATFHLRSNWAVHEVMDELGVDVEILNPEQAGRLLLLPEAELPGMKLKKNVFYGRPSVEQKKGIKLGDMAFFQKTITDQLKQPDLKAEEDHSFYLAENNDLCSHVLIVGTTGSGKTERAVSILNKLDSKKFQIIVLETAKKTYRDKLRRGDEKPHIYTLGVSSQRPFRINPFYFDPGTSLKRHVSILSDAMSELLPVEALIGPKLREAIERCYAECGWNIETDTYTGKGFTRYPDMILFNSEVYKICSTFEDYGPEVKGNYKGALLNRARIFIDDLYQDIFAFDGNKTFSELFPGDTIIEM
ncbi:MAG: DUF87 domain-containing protein [Deltaproteobacteria bacterium]